MLTQNDTSGFEGKDEDEQKESKKLNEKLRQLREVLYAEHEQKVLVALQAMDTGGKDGVIRRVFEGVNPQGVRVAHFGIPTLEELDHDFLWRAQATPKGFSSLEFTSSFRWMFGGGRYREINDFERLIS